MRMKLTCRIVADGSCWSTQATCILLTFCRTTGRQSVRDMSARRSTTSCAETSRVLTSRCDLAAHQVNRRPDPPALSLAACDAGTACLQPTVWRYFQWRIYRGFGGGVSEPGTPLPSTRPSLKGKAGPILSVFFALIVHSELKSVHPGFPVAFIF